jgi:hypothetical protein
VPESTALTCSGILAHARVVAWQLRGASATDMISDPNTAKYVGELMLQFLLDMEKSLDVVKKSSASDESLMYVKAVGNVSFRVVNDVLEPLYAQHPELKPPSWD